MKVEQAPLSVTDAPPSARSASIAHHSSQYDWEVPPVASSDAGYGERCHPVDVGNPKPRTGSPSGLSADRPTDQEWSDAPRSVNSEAEQTWEVTSGHGSGQDDPRALRPDKSRILQLILQNPKKYSYANSTFLNLVDEQLLAG